MVDGRHATAQESLTSISSQIDAFVRAGETTTLRWRQFFREHDIVPLELVYEEMVEDLEGTVRARPWFRRNSGSGRQAAAADLAQAGRRPIAGMGGALSSDLRGRAWMTSIRRHARHDGIQVSCRVDRARRDAMVPNALRANGEVSPARLRGDRPRSCSHSRPDTNSSSICRSARCAAAGGFADPAACLTISSDGPRSVAELEQSAPSDR